VLPVFIYQYQPKRTVPLANPFPDVFAGNELSAETGNGLSLFFIKFHDRPLSGNKTVSRPMQF
jgi:hypothetical protein